MIEKINKLFAGTGISEVDQVNAIESLMSQAADNSTLQAMALANTVVDFASSPEMEVVVEGAAYTAGEGHSKAIAAILTKMRMTDVVKVMLQGGLYGATRRAAEQDAS